MTNRKQSKDFKAKLATFDVNKRYPIADALQMVKQNAYEKFDASVEVHVNTGIDPRKGDQQVRASVTLPHGTGKTKRVAVFAEGDKANEAREAGADLVGGADFIQEIKQSGKCDFDIAIATMDMMPKLASLAKLLGPRGLMPSPKNETVTANVKQAIEQVKKGRVSFKNDDSANVHLGIGKVSFDAEKLIENYKAFLDTLKKSKPSSSKGTFLKSVTIKSTMGPGIKVIID